MDAKEFVKKFGWDYAIKFLNYDPTIGSDKCDLDFGEHEKLVELVDAYKLVQYYGGLDNAKEYLNRYKQFPFIKKLNKAIKLVESVDEN